MQREVTLLADLDSLYRGAQRASAVRDAVPNAEAAVRLHMSHVQRLLLLDRPAQSATLTGSSRYLREPRLKHLQGLDCDPTIVLAEHNALIQREIRAMVAGLESLEPGILVIAVGDGARGEDADHLAAELDWLAELGWEIEIAGWASDLDPALDSLADDWPSVRLRFLDDRFMQVTFLEGWQRRAEPLDLEEPAMGDPGRSSDADLDIEAAAQLAGSILRDMVDQGEIEPPQADETGVTYAMPMDAFGLFAVRLRSS